MNNGNTPYVREILTSQVPARVDRSANNSAVTYLPQQRFDLNEGLTTQILTNYNLPSFDGQPNGNQGSGSTLIDLLQQEVDDRIDNVPRTQTSILLLEGNYTTDDFIGKYLCHKRYKTYAKFMCQNPQCLNQWTSDNTTVEMLL